jgi:hypothetical protein
VAKYLAKNQVDCRNLKEYVSIIDFIKKGNEQRLGKLAWMIKAPRILNDLSPMHREALEELKKLTRSRKRTNNVLDQETATLLLPDFLPKNLCKHGIEIIEKIMARESLKKFGRLVNFYDKNKHLFPAFGGSGGEMKVVALQDMISWDRTFDEINVFQNIPHTEAKAYVAQYLAQNVADGCTVEDFLFIVDFIKDGNSKLLGKLAWEIEFSGIWVGLSTMHREALDRVKELLPNPDDVNEFLDETIAMLLVPDFLPKKLWECGITIIEKYSQNIKSLQMSD